jgi:hydroxyacylglutathione hydrolase
MLKKISSHNHYKFFFILFFSLGFISFRNDNFSLEIQPLEKSYVKNNSLDKILTNEKTFKASMILKVFVSGPLANNVILLSSEKMKKAAVVDPASGSFKKIMAYIQEQGLQLESIFITHSHWDHIGDVAKLKEETGAKVFVHKLDSPSLKVPESDFLPIRGVEADKNYADGDKIQVGEIEIEIIHTPGHSPGSICLYIPKEKTLISGDTLFAGSMGKISFSSSRPDLMWDSLKKLSQLPKDTIVYPGHGATTTIGKESWLANAKEIFGYSTDRD